VYLIDNLHIFIDDFKSYVVIVPPKPIPMEVKENEFTNGEITVTYEPKKCMHADICAQGLSEVFRTSVIPWINLDAADSEKIMAQIEKCPSKALRFSRSTTEVLSV